MPLARRQISFSLDTDRAASMSRAHVVGTSSSLIGTAPMSWLVSVNDALDVVLDPGARTCVQRPRAPPGWAAGAAPLAGRCGEVHERITVVVGGPDTQIRVDRPPLALPAPSPSPSRGGGPGCFDAGPGTRPARASATTLIAARSFGRRTARPAARPRSSSARTRVRAPAAPRVSSDAERTAGRLRRRHGHWFVREVGIEAAPVDDRRWQESPPTEGCANAASPGCCRGAL